MCIIFNNSLYVCNIIDYICLIIFLFFSLQCSNVICSLYFFILMYVIIFSNYSLDVHVLLCIIFNKLILYYIYIYVLI